MSTSTPAGIAGDIREGTLVDAGPPFQRRDTVRLRSGGLDMMVFNIRPHPDFGGWAAEVTWMDNHGQIRELRIASDMLVLVSRGSDQ